MKNVRLIVGIIVVTVMVLSVGGLRTSTARAQGGASQAVSTGAGSSVDVPRAVSVNMSSLPLATAADTQAFRSRRPRNGLSDSEWAQRKAAAGRGQLQPVTLGSSAPSLSSGNGALTAGTLLSFNGDTEFEFCSNATPADQALAIGDGSNPIVQVVNDCLSVWNPAGTRLSGPFALQTFFGLPAGTFVTDPRALYDWYNHRFIVTIIDTDNANSNNYDIALSQSDDPTAGWWLYRLATPSATGAVPDFPRLGQDRTSFFPNTTVLPGAIYLASNLFSNATGGYLHEEWLVLPKNRMYQGLGFSFWFFFGMTSGGVPTDTSQPVNVWSPYEQPRAEFLITSKNLFNGQCAAGCNGLTVWAISNPFTFTVGGQSPELSAVVISTANNYSLAPNAPQSGGPNNIETSDTRISGEATYGHGFIHAGLDGSNGAGGTSSIIYKVQPFLNSTNAARCTAAVSLGLCPQITGASIRNETILNYGGTTAAFFPTPQPDLEGNVNIVFNFSSTAAFVGLAYISQRVTQPVGTFVDNGLFVAAGQGQYTQGRWGDYTAVAPAGVFYATGDGGFTGNNGMGFSGMYAGVGNRWLTRIGFTRLSSPGQP